MKATNGLHRDTVKPHTTARHSPAVTQLPNRTHTRGQEPPVHRADSLRSRLPGTKLNGLGRSSAAPTLQTATVFCPCETGTNQGKQLRASSPPHPFPWPSAPDGAWSPAGQQASPSLRGTRLGMAPRSSSFPVRQARLDITRGHHSRDSRVTSRATCKTCISAIVMLKNGPMDHLFGSCQQAKDNKC